MSKAFDMELFLAGVLTGSFGSAGLPYLRFISLRTAATHSPDNERDSSHFDMGVLPMHSFNPSKICISIHHAMATHLPTPGGAK